jgi:hypothetical protein
MLINPDVRKLRLEDGEFGANLIWTQKKEKK